MNNFQATLTPTQLLCNWYQPITALTPNPVTPLTLTPNPVTPLTPNPDHPNPKLIQLLLCNAKYKGN